MDIKAIFENSFEVFRKAEACADAGRDDEALVLYQRAASSLVLVARHYEKERHTRTDDSISPYHQMALEYSDLSIKRAEAIKARQTGPHVAGGDTGAKTSSGPPQIKSPSGVRAALESEASVVVRAKRVLATAGDLLEKADAASRRGNAATAKQLSIQAAELCMNCIQGLNAHVKAAGAAGGAASPGSSRTVLEVRASIEQLCSACLSRAEALSNAIPFSDPKTTGELRASSSRQPSQAEMLALLHPPNALMRAALAAQEDAAAVRQRVAAGDSSSALSIHNTSLSALAETCVTVRGAAVPPGVDPLSLYDVCVARYRASLAARDAMEALLKEGNVASSVLKEVASRITGLQSRVALQQAEGAVSRARQEIDELQITARWVHVPVAPGTTAAGGTAKAADPAASAATDPSKRVTVVPGFGPGVAHPREGVAGQVPSKNPEQLAWEAKQRAALVEAAAAGPSTAPAAPDLPAAGPESWQQPPAGATGKGSIDVYPGPPGYAGSGPPVYPSGAAPSPASWGPGQVYGAVPPPASAGAGLASGTGAGSSGAAGDMASKAKSVRSGSKPGYTGSSGATGTGGGKGAGAGDWTIV